MAATTEFEREGLEGSEGEKPQDMFGRGTRICLSFDPLATFALKLLKANGKRRVALSSDPVKNDETVLARRGTLSA
ncbi:MAG: hypothetical protein H7210_10275 [Pyrinomonadaceae bacterium]|nr:hypothetical protein [Phycisphaerales bacterium]